MTEPKSSARKCRSKLLWLALVGITAGASFVFGALAAPLNLQSAAASAQATNSPPVPQWQIDAGGKKEFDVVSVKQNTAAPTPQTVASNVPLGPQDAFTPTGGLFSASDNGLITYIAFAYKLTPQEYAAVVSQLPKWAAANRYDIQAHASGNPTKNQYRLMMQSLLAGRFKLAIHHETRQVPVLALVLDKSGKTGPQFRPHSDDSTCSSTPDSPPATHFAPTLADGFPKMCHVIYPVEPSTPGRYRIAGRSIPMPMVASQLVGGYGDAFGNLSRPILDKTRLTGTFDFVIEFTPEFHTPVPPNFQPDTTGPTFLEALNQQLGLKLESQTGPVDTIVVDHVEEPSQN
jgi:uncharacterized protein (TIGR03435 family)